MDILTQLAAARGSAPQPAMATRRRAGEGRSGRPVDPNSRRQRVLAWLDSRTLGATTREIADGIGEACDQAFYTALSELAREGQIERIAQAPRDASRNLWRTA